MVARLVPLQAVCCLHWSSQSSHCLYNIKTCWVIHTQSGIEPISVGSTTSSHHHKWFLYNLNCLPTTLDMTQDEMFVALKRKLKLIFLFLLFTRSWCHQANKMNQISQTHDSHNVITVNTNTYVLHIINPFPIINKEGIFLQDHPWVYFLTFCWTD